MFRLLVCLFVKLVVWLSGRQNINNNIILRVFFLFLNIYYNSNLYHLITTIM